MNMTTANPDRHPQRSSLKRKHKLLIALAAIPGGIVTGLIVLRLCGLICPYSMPTGSMSPAIKAGDHFLMEGFTFLTRKPRRGDVVVFRAKSIPGLPPDQTYVKRVAGEPHDRVRIANQTLFINGNAVTLSNSAGKIDYVLIPQFHTMDENTEVTVPENCYFVLGDNSINSLDSRSWGSVPAQNIRGRVAFSYWPPDQAGAVK